MGKTNYVISQTPQVWLDHIVSEMGGVLNLRWNYVADLFPSGMIESMFSAYTNLLHKLANEDDIWLNNSWELIQKIQPSISSVLLKEPENDHPQTLLQELFEQQVALNPQNIAIVNSYKTFTYQQLSQRVNKVAHRLRQEEVQPNQIVAVVMEKGWEQIIAVLGILAAGGAYLPIESQIATERREYILNEAEVEIILSQSAVNLENQNNRQVFNIDEIDSWDSPITSLTSVQKPSDLAYIIYTSGSTGQPKGVMIDHQGAVNTILDINDRFKISSSDKIFALSSLSFDLSVYDIFGTLAAGATIVIPEANKIKDPSSWVSLINQEKVTVWNSVPILMKLLTEYVAPNPILKLESLRLALLSGDWIPLNLPTEIKQIAPSAEVIGLGGATEASIWSILYPIEQVNPDWKTIPYGKAMKNQQVYVLNEDLIPCPPWVSGSIYIGGIGLSLGYWKQEQKTANSFITHPITKQRLYRTGDRGRYLPDGNIEFLGREDFQVKIQGNRIELAEIELNLKAYDLVKLAVVNAIGEKDAEKQLVAYVSLDESFELPSSTKLKAELINHLKQKLPAYMIPHHVIILKEFPLNANGKIDRKALPQPEEEQSSRLPSLSTSDSQNTVAEKISEIVAQIFKLEKIELDMDWLSMGATSVDMIRIANALDQEFDYRPDFDQLYGQPYAIAIADIIIQELGLNKPVEIIASQTAKQYQIIKDPQKRNEFKGAQRGIRQDLSSTVNLNKVDAQKLISQYQQRNSIREFSNKIISEREFSQFISCLSQIELDNQPRYLYASAGGLYPVQIYIHIKPQRIEGIEGGIYYYHPQKHHLAKVSDVGELDETIHERLINRPIYKSSAFSIFLIAQMRAIEPMYGELARDFCLLEAGYMAQLMMSKSKEYQLGLCPIGTLKFAQIKDLFQLDEGHLLLHSLQGGKLKDHSDDNMIINEVYDFDSVNEPDMSLPIPISSGDNREEIEI